MSPLGFDDKQIYNFIANRFSKTATKVQEQALNWLQVRELNAPFANLKIHLKS